VFQWWTGTVQRGDRIIPPNFDVSGLVPIAYALFAFMLGALLGTLVQRTGWAFALGLPLFAAFRYLERTYVRSVLVPPVDTSAVQIAPSNNWVLNQGYIPLGQSSPGRGITWQSESASMLNCTNPTGGKAVQSVQHCEWRLMAHGRPGSGCGVSNPPPRETRSAHGRRVRKNATNRQPLVAPTGPIDPVSVFRRM